MELIFAGITLSAVLMATFVNHTRRAILSLWVAGLGVGAMYLTIGAEFLAIIQWIVSTLVTISFIFFAVMFGEYNLPTPRGVGNSLVLTFLSLFVGAGFTAAIWTGGREFPESAFVLEAGGSDLGIVGR